MQRVIHFQDATVSALAFSNGAAPVHVDQDPLYLAVAGSPRVAVYDAAAPPPPPGAPPGADAPVATNAAPLFVFEGHAAPVTAVGFDPTSPRPRFGFSASEDGWLKVWDPRLPLARAPPGPAAAPCAPSAEVLAAFRRCATDKPKVNAAVFYAGKHAGVDVELFITADAKGRISVWDYMSKALRATVRPHAVYDEGDAADAAAGGAKAGGGGGCEAGGSAAHARQAEAEARRPARRQRTAASMDVSPTYEETRYGGKREPSADRRGVHLQTLELFQAADGGGAMVAAADLRGVLFVYRVGGMLADERAPPYASWAVAENDPAQRFASKVYVTRTRVSQDGKVLACTLSTGALRLYDLTNVPRMLRGELPTVPLMRECVRHTGWAWDAAFVGDANNYVFTCGSDMQVLLWFLDEERPSDYPGHSRAVVCLAVKEQYSSCPSPPPAAE